MSSIANADTSDASERIVTGSWDLLCHDAMTVRRAVFIVEQRIAESDEWDPWDAQCVHCVVHHGTQAVATGRLLPDGHIGRMAVLASSRHSGVGGRVLSTLVAVARARGDTLLRLHAQAYAQAFYEKFGFTARGAHFLEVGIDHVEMVRHLT